MPFANRPVAFDSINFEPGFPSLSRFQCNPWDMTAQAGACGSPPVVVGRERAGMPATAAMRRAMIETGAGPSDVLAAVARGVVPSGLAGCGCGCGCGGGCGLGDVQSIMSDPVGWASANAIPLGVGAALAYLLFGRRR